MLSTIELLQHYSASIDFTEELEGGMLPAYILTQAVVDINTFITLAGNLLDGLDMGQVMHDLWLTRNGHGCGFWDGKSRGYSILQAAELTAIAESMGVVDI